MTRSTSRACASAPGIGWNTGRSRRPHGGWIRTPSQPHPARNGPHLTASNSLGRVRPPCLGVLCCGSSDRTIRTDDVGARSHDCRVPAAGQLRACPVVGPSLLLDGFGGRRVGAGGVAFRGRHAALHLGALNFLQARRQSGASWATASCASRHHSPAASPQKGRAPSRTQTDPSVICFAPTRHADERGVCRLHAEDLEQVVTCTMVEAGGSAGKYRRRTAWILSNSRMSVT